MPLLLLFPVGRLDRVEPLPDVQVPPLDAVEWVATGHLSSRNEEHGTVVPVARAVNDGQTIADFRKHRDLVSSWLMRQGEREYVHRSSADDDQKARRLADLDDRQREIVWALRAVRDRVRSQALAPLRCRRLTGRPSWRTR